MMAAIRRSYVDCSFGQLHVTEDEQPRGSGQPLLLLNTRSRSSLRLLPLLRPSYRGIIIDIPGAGSSSPPPYGATMRDIAGCLADYLDAAAIDRASIFGFHTGNKVAAAFAAHYPERVDRLIVAGKTHSMVPGHESRNTAMQEYMAGRPPDVAVSQLEGKYIDSYSEQQAGWEAMYQANYAFDFAAALSSLRARTLVVEVVTVEEDKKFGSQSQTLVGTMAHAVAICVPQTDPTGIETYIGADRMASIILDFLESERN
jgi:pimeloyl-ACP methyl ester carboxylesterase